MNLYLPTTGGSWTAAGVDNPCHFLKLTFRDGLQLELREMQDADGKFHLALYAPGGETISIKPQVSNAIMVRADL